MNKKPTPMRMLNPRMIEGLRDLCMDINYSFQSDFIEMVELGCYIGESTNIFLNNLNLSMLTCVDLWESNSKYHFNDIDKAYEIFLAQFKDNAIIEIKREHSRSGGRSVDVVYIDANHSYEEVKADILWWRQLITSGGIISGHDYEDKGKYGVKQAVDEIFGKPDKVYKDTSWMVKL